MGAQVLGVSCDSRLTLAAWKRAMSYEIVLLSDFWPHGEVGRRYGVFDDRYGVDTRGGFVIDAEGIVRAVVSSDDLARPRDVHAYVAHLKEL